MAARNTKRTSTGRLIAVSTKPRVLAAAGPRASKRTAPLRSASAAAQDHSKDELLRQLLDSQKQVGELQARLEAVTNQLAWISDRLHDLLDDEK